MGLLVVIKRRGAERKQNIEGEGRKPNQEGAARAVRGDGGDDHQREKGEGLQAVVTRRLVRLDDHLNKEEDSLPG